ncbi:MAG: sulfatase-like hydrolase/transferase, partial [Paramuribaculum sp.]|nr:sulfatase-like hydrolase/transferase [Paramuribaculum sp.]
VQALKQKGLYDNTLILFTSDHGDMQGDHNMWRKTYAYQGSALIPMIVKTPEGFGGSLQAGSVVEQPVELRDVLPTFLDACGDSVPADMDGRSMLSLIKNPKASWREWIDMEHATSYADFNYWTALTDGHIKYIWFVRTGDEQLFDLDADPEESVNLAGKQKYGKLLKSMREKMAKHLEERGEQWVKNGVLQTHAETVLYGPNYPK